MFIDRGGHRDNKEIASPEVPGVNRIGEILGAAHLLIGDLTRAIDAAQQLIYSLSVNVETHDRELACHVYGERQSDVTEADNSDAHVLETNYRHVPPNAPAGHSRQQARAVLSDHIMYGHSERKALHKAKSKYQVRSYTTASGSRKNGARRIRYAETTP